MVRLDRGWVSFGAFLFLGSWRGQGRAWRYHGAGVLPYLMLSCRLLVYTFAIPAGDYTNRHGQSSLRCHLSGRHEASMSGTLHITSEDSASNPSSNILCPLARSPPRHHPVQSAGSCSNRSLANRSRSREASEPPSSASSARAMALSAHRWQGCSSARA